MKTLKVLALVVIALFVFSESAIAKGFQRKPDPRSMTPEEFVLKFPDSIFPENRAICEDNCIFLSKGKILSRDWKGDPAIESPSEFKGFGFETPFVLVRSQELLPKELGEFAETFMKTKSNTRCQEVQLFWQPSRGRLLYELIFGDVRSLDERNAYRVRAKKVCGRFCLVQEKDLSELSSTFLYDLLYDSPVFLFLFCLLGIVLAVSVFYGFKSKPPTK